MGGGKVNVTVCQKMGQCKKKKNTKKQTKKKKSKSVEGENHRSADPSLQVGTRQLTTSTVRVGAATVTESGAEIILKKYI